MKRLPCLGLLSAAALVAVAALPRGTAASAPAWMALPAAAPTLAWEAAALPAAPAPPAASGGNRGPLPNSTLPSPPQRCSVRSSDNPPQCSTMAPGERCSTHEGDTVGGCSAIGNTPGGRVGCSTLSIRSVCSVLEPPITPDPGRECSARHLPGSGAVVACSTLARGTRQACTAENPGVQHICSAFTAGAHCSVVHRQGVPRVCTVFFAGDKVCSAFNLATAQCSVHSGLSGECSAFHSADPANCTSFVAGGECSVIHGAPGTQCRQP